MDRLAAMHAFVRVVELQTFTAAAAQLRVTQSTVSKWVAALEEDCGALLLARTTRRTRLTDAGQLFYERAREVLAGYDAMMAEMRDTAATSLRGRVRVSVPVVFGRLFVVDAVAAFMREHPEVEVDLVFNDRYVSLVEEGYDVALRVGIPADSSLRARQIATTPRRLVAAPSYLVRRDKPRRPADLTTHDCLIHSGLNTGAIWAFERAGNVHRTRVTGRFAANNSEALLTLAEAGLGVALLGSWLVDEGVSAGRLVELLPDYSLPAAPVQALMPPGRHVHPRVRAFVEALAQALASGGLRRGAA